MLLIHSVKESQVNQISPSMQECPCCGSDVPVAQDELITLAEMVMETMTVEYNEVSYQCRRSGEIWKSSTQIFKDMDARREAYKLKKLELALERKLSWRIR